MALTYDAYIPKIMSGYVPFTGRYTDMYQCLLYLKKMTKPVERRINTNTNTFIFKAIIANSLDVNDVSSYYVPTFVLDESNKIFVYENKLVEQIADLYTRFFIPHQNSILNIGTIITFRISAVDYSHALALYFKIHTNVNKKNIKIECRLFDPYGENSTLPGLRTNIINYVLKPINSYFSTNNNNFSVNTILDIPNMSAPYGPFVGQGYQDITLSLNRDYDPSGFCVVNCTLFLNLLSLYDELEATYNELEIYMLNKTDRDHPSLELDLITFQYENSIIYNRSLIIKIHNEVGLHESYFYMASDIYDFTHHTEWNGLNRLLSEMLSVGLISFFYMSYTDPNGGLIKNKFLVSRDISVISLRLFDMRTNQDVFIIPKFGGGFELKNESTVLNNGENITIYIPDLLRYAQALETNRTRLGIKNNFGRCKRRRRRKNCKKCK